MKLKFLIEYRGRETMEDTVPAGTVIEIDEEAAQAVLSAGFAEEMLPAPAPLPADPLPKGSDLREEKQAQVSTGKKGGKHG